LKDKEIYKTQALLHAVKGSLFIPH